MSEIWKSVSNFPTYQVSNLGRIRSLNVRVLARWGKLRSRKGRVLRMYAIRGGYLQVRLGRNGVIYNKLVHRLVLEAFVGSCPKGMQSCHNDGKPTNNLVGNLRWGTPKDNMRDIEKHGTRVRHYGIKNGRSRFTEDCVKNIRKQYRTGKYTMKEIGKQYGVAQQTIQYIISVGWKHI